MTELAVRSPFGITDLGNQCGLNPMQAALRDIHRDEWAPVGFPRVELFRNKLQSAVVEAGAHFAGKTQPRILVVPQKQGTKCRPASLGITVSPNHHLLLIHTFPLKPIPGTSAPVGAIRLLGD